MFSHAFPSSFGEHQIRRRDSFILFLPLRNVPICLPSYIFFHTRFFFPSQNPIFPPSSQTVRLSLPLDPLSLLPLIAKNDLSIFRRTPSQLARYIAWSRDIKAQYGSIQTYICQQRLHWQPEPATQDQPQQPQSRFAVVDPTPFGSSHDYRILRNDWPYGFTPDIDHMVVWLKTPLAVNTADGSLVPEAWALVQGFVNRVFVKRLARERQQEWDGDGKGKEAVAAEDRVLWFKNWTALQSVGALEHFHVLVRGAGEDLLWEWTGEGKRGS